MERVGLREIYPIGNEGYPRHLAHFGGLGSHGREGLVCYHTSGLQRRFLARQRLNDGAEIRGVFW
jgi:hypothetical protein